MRRTTHWLEPPTYLATKNTGNMSYLTYNCLAQVITNSNKITNKNAEYTLTDYCRSSKLTGVGHDNM